MIPPLKIAVTGANGFIGRHVVAELNERGHEVLALSRPDFKIDSASYWSYEDIGAPDILIHLAWGYLDRFGDERHFEQELPNHYRFLSGLAKTGLKNLFVLGTCFEYGLTDGVLGEEEATQPVLPYGFAKNALRCQLEFLRQKQDFNLTWGRLFYVYGDGQPERTLLSQLKKAIETKEKIFNMSGGQQKRDFLPVKQVADYVTKLALHQKNLGIVNICSGQPITILQFVQNYLEQHQAKLDLNLGFYPYAEYEPMAFWGCNKKRNQILGETCNQT
jgi:nucleoside-diphosphate-sugar epimerase